MILSFQTDRPWQTVQVNTVCYSVCIVGTHYSNVEPHNSNFRVITTNFLDVRIFRKIMVSREFRVDALQLFLMFKLLVFELLEVLP